MIFTVNGIVKCKEVEIVDNVPSSDYVFKDDYELMPLDSLESFVKTNKHLPGIPTEAEVLENGIDLGEMHKKLLEKVEELSLYIIEQEKRIRALEAENNEDE
ncbi:MAG: hypothetical protein ACP5DZ_09105 [Bacteroidales bacterium]